MFTRSKHIAPGAITLLAVMLSAAATQPNADQASTVVDPVGDALFHAPTFQDIVLGEMTKTTGGDFELLMELAGPIPANPLMPPPARSEMWWGWGFDLDPTAFPRGYPFEASAQRRMEFLVYVSWDGAAFAGIAIDRRPLLSGGEAIITPIQFSIDGRIVEAVLPSTLIGDVPASFIWDTFTKAWSGPVGSEGDHSPDVAFSIFNP